MHPGPRYSTAKIPCPLLASYGTGLRCLSIKRLPRLSSFARASNQAVLRGIRGESPLRQVVSWFVSRFLVLHIVFLSLLLLPAGVPTGWSGEAPEGGKEKKDGKEDQAPKAEGPEHNVTLNEEEEVSRLLKKAQVARQKAEQDPQFWPECVEAYARILYKYPNTVYLAHWDDGKERSSKAWGLGLYRATQEKIAAELASLPAAGLATYRAVNDPKAGALFVEARQQMDERKVEQVAETFFSSSFGDDATLWLAETAYDRGAFRQAASRLERVAKHPDHAVSSASILARLFLAQLRNGQVQEAQASLAKLKERAQAEGLEKFRIAHQSGAEALALLERKLAAAPKAAGAPATREQGWDTYFGNAAHVRKIPDKREVGVKKWSESITKLLGGGEEEAAKTATIRDPWGRTTTLPQLMETNLVARGRFFFLSGGRVVVCHSVTNPDSKRPIFGHPTPLPAAAGETDLQNARGQRFALRRRAQFCTLGDDHLFVTLGPDANVVLPQWGGQELKQQPNWIVALGKKPGGKMGIESGSLLWTLEPDADNVNSKKDKDWLREVYFATSPTYQAGTLYVLAVAMNGTTHESWVVAIDGTSGRILWRTMVCSAQTALYAGVIQPDVGLPVAVAGGTVYAVTNLGAVAALEASSGSIRWIRIYDRIPSATQQQVWGQRSEAEVADFWAPNPPLIHEGLLIVTPQDSPNLYALDAQTGRRIWQLSRVSDLGLGAPDDAENLTHVLGIARDRLVVTGRDVLFIDLKGGRREEKVPLRETYEIRGRGLVTENTILVPTDEALLFIDATLTEKGKPTAKLLKEFKWQKEEAGNLFIAGDVLYSVTASHIHAYFDLKEVEAKLQERIQADPGDLAAYLELGDVRHRAEQYERAIQAYDTGLGHAAKRDLNDTAIRDLAQHLKSNRFESFFALGEKLFDKEKATAAERFSLALAAATDGSQSVRTLWRLAECALDAKNPALAVERYHRLLTDFGDVVYSFEPRSASKASVFAERRIGQLKSEHPGSTKDLETKAGQAVAEALATKDAAKLETALERFPHTEAYQRGLFELGSLLLKQGKPDEARLQLQKYLRRFGDSPQLPTVLAQLALAYEAAGMLGSAKYTLRKLAADPKLAKTVLQLPDGKTPEAAAWAAGRLNEPLFLKPSTQAVRSLGNGKLAESWSRPAPPSVVILTPEGQPPKAALRNLFLIENATELVARSGLSGEEIWAQRPKIPEGFQGLRTQTAWSGEILAVAGRDELVALNHETGREAWRFTLKPNPANGGGPATSLQSAERCLVLTQAGGLLTVLDTAAGKVVWQQPVEGGLVLGDPAIGEGFLAVAAANQPKQKLTVYEFGTGLRRFELEVPGEKLSLPPLAVGERIYLVGGDSILRAYDATNGKQLWEYALGNPAQDLQADHDRVLVVLKNLELLACDPNATEDAGRLAWKAVPENPGAFAGLLADGDHVFLGVQRPNAPGELAAYKASGGKLVWKAEMTPSNNNRIELEQLAREFILTTRGSYDPQGRQVALVALVNRENGLLVWRKDFASARIFSLALLDGAVVVGDGRKLTGYRAEDPERTRQELAALQEKVKATPADANLKLRLAQLHFDNREYGKAQNELLELIREPALGEAAFAAAFERFSHYRLAASEQPKEKEILRFQRLPAPAALKIDGSLEDWSGLAETRLEGWRRLYLAGEDDLRQVFKKGAWKGSQDLTVSLRAACDEQHLYLGVAVTDDIHLNPQDKGIDLWNGDSLQLAFDMERDRSPRFQGNDFEMGLALNGKGELLLWRWVERGKYIMKALEAEAKVVRNEATHLTVYELKLPLAYLGAKSEPGLQFGFTCLVNDMDAPAGVAKGMALSPGIWDPKSPNQYAVGELGQKP